VLGGTRITGGAGSVVGTFLGLVLLGLLRYGLDMHSVPQQDQAVVVGLLLVVIAVLNEAWVSRAER
jgi:ribose transport system permease protein